MTKSIGRYPFLLLLISMIMVLSLVLSNTTPVYAQQDKPGKNGENQGQGQGQEKALGKLFERLLAWQARQELQFQQAEYISELLDDFIEKSTAEGFDTTLLAEELNAFKEQIKEARKSYQLAQVTLATHYGIDEVGEIYSVKSTRQMIKVASRSFGESHRLLSRAVRDIYQALRDWRSASGEAASVLDVSELSAP